VLTTYIFVIFVFFVISGLRVHGGGGVVNPCALCVDVTIHTSRYSTEGIHTIILIIIYILLYIYI